MKKNININWYFRYGNEPEDCHEINKDLFSPIGLPHTFDLPYYGETGFYVGYGIYKKELELSEDDVKNKIFIEFLGVFQEADIFLNAAVRAATGADIPELPQIVQTVQKPLMVEILNFKQHTDFAFQVKSV